MEVPPACDDEHRGGPVDPVSLAVSALTSGFVPVADLAVPRAAVQRADSRHRRVRFTILDGYARVTEHDGRVTIEGAVADVEQLSSRSWRVSLAEGETFTVEKRGCNCGGG